MIAAVQNGLSVLLVFVGLLMMLIGSVGIIRLPDFFSRTHAAGKVDTVGIAILLAGFAVYEGWTLASAKLVVAIGFVLLTNPVAIHVLARAALRVGVKPWRRGMSVPGRARK